MPEPRYPIVVYLTWEQVQRARSNYEWQERGNDLEKALWSACESAQFVPKDKPRPEQPPGGSVILASIAPDLDRIKLVRAGDLWYPDAPGQAGGTYRWNDLNDVEVLYDSARI